MSRASALHRLQTVDAELDQISSRLAQIQAILSDSEQVSRRREALLEAETKLKAARSAADTAERTVASQRAKIDRAEQTLYSGSVRNPKELQDLQKETEALKRYLITLEDRLLEAMVGLEEAELVRDAAAEELARVEAARAEEHSALEEERGKLLASQERLQAEREAALASVAQQDLALYTQLRQSTGGVAVALLEDGSCSACGMATAASVQQLIRSGSNLVRCDQCGRIIYAG
jgi:predicted  nucleic acid-binding Zn-ribbon protein